MCNLEKNTPCNWQVVEVVGQHLEHEALVVVVHEDVMQLHDKPLVLRILLVQLPVCLC